MHVARAAILANRRTISDIKTLKKNLDEVANTALRSETSEGRDCSGRPAIITMEAVRIALRRLDHGESAAKTQLKSESRKDSNGKSGSTYSKTKTTKKLSAVFARVIISLAITLSVKKFI